ncbi:P-loop containing nucleoside triphosphate hydrolase protein, partial [Pelagophyceae sp. CCMP2097]
MAAPDSAASELGRLLEGLGVPAEVCEGYSAATGIRSLHAWQRSCLNETRALDGGSAVVCVDTAGGKSLIAEAAAMVRLFASDEAHVLYVLPYVAMVSEKAAALTSALAPYNAASPRSERCSVHDCGETADWVDIKLDARKALTLCTPEAACGLLDRHALELLDRCESRRPAKRLAPSGHAALGSLALVIVDELHMVGDAGRGPTFEKLVTKLRALDAAKIRALDAESARQAASDAAAGEANDAAAESGAAAANDAAAGEAESDVSAAVPRDGAAAAPRGVQMIGLSATLANANVLARWLGATLHVASHRPVPLERRLKECKDDAAVFREVQGVVKKSVEAGEHVLVFYAYPSQASEAAKRLATVLRVGAGPAGAPAAAKAAAATKAAARRRAAAAQLKAESKSGAAPAALVELLANADNVHGGNAASAGRQIGTPGKAVAVYYVPATTAAEPHRGSIARRGRTDGSLRSPRDGPLRGD